MVSLDGWDPARLSLYKKDWHAFFELSPYHTIPTFNCTTNYARSFARLLGTSATLTCAVLDNFRWHESNESNESNAGYDKIWALNLAESSGRPRRTFWSLSWSRSCQSCFQLWGFGPFQTITTYDRYDKIWQHCKTRWRQWPACISNLKFEAVISVATKDKHGRFEQRMPHCVGLPTFTQATRTEIWWSEVCPRSCRYKEQEWPIESIARMKKW